MRRWLWVSKDMQVSIKYFIMLNATATGKKTFFYGCKTLGYLIYVAGIYLPQHHKKQVHLFMVRQWYLSAEPCHTAVVQEWLQEHVKFFAVLTWRPKTLDLNLIQHLTQIPEETFRSLVEIMTDQVRIVLLVHDGIPLDEACSHDSTDQCI